jgi:ATP-binding cassette subfamily B protein
MLVMRLARAEASADRIHEVLDARPDVPPAADGIRVLSRRGRVVFEEVSFAYTTSVVKSSMLNGEDTAAMPVKSSMLNSEGTAANPAHIDEQPSTFNLQPSTTNDLVLKNISFTAEPGSTVAILGATGAGKSSLINLIPRFYDVSAGRITVDGIDVRRIDEASLRSAIGIALQESVLFSGTIRDNIRYGKPDASEEEVIAAAQMAQAHEFISRFPQGYDSIVGQRGVNLSGGQKQRIAIARALLTRPSILILDDSTSAVDVTTESHIQRALAELPERPTRIVVAQRISTVLGADTILVLDDGQVAAQGSHAELLATSPIYREIYESQVEHGAITNE